MKRERVDPAWAWPKKFNFWVGWKLDETVQLSGLVAFDVDGNVIGKEDCYAQSKQTFKNIEEALASAGATMSDLVKITTYLTDMADYQAFSKARTETFPDGVPSSTTICSPALIMPDLLVEIEALAIIGSGGD
jgi:enamine deaminase RidA (YjgF/YER057c/UK114 family)